LQRILDLGYSGQTVLQLADPMSGTRGDILIEDCKIVFGAQTYEPEMKGYSALRAICGFVLSDYRLVQLEGDYSDQLSSPLRLELERLLKYVPQLPEDESLLGDIYSPSGVSSGGSFSLSSPETALSEEIPIETIASESRESFAGLIGELEVAAQPADRSGGWKLVDEVKVGARPQISASAESDSVTDGELLHLVQANRTKPTESSQHKKIKFRPSNLFANPKTFFLTCFSLIRAILPKAILIFASVFLLVVLVKGGFFLVPKYFKSGWRSQTAKTSSASDSQSQPKALLSRIMQKPIGHTDPQGSPNHGTISPEALSPGTLKVPLSGPLQESPIKEPLKEPIKVEPKPMSRRDPNHLRVNKSSLRRAQVKAQPKPSLQAAPRLPAASDPEPEYKGPSSLSGEPIKHRHAYQTMPSTE
jgi:hypothetical protein